MDRQEAIFDTLGASLYTTYFISMGWCSKFGDLEIDQGEDGLMRGGNTTFIWAVLGQACLIREVPHSWRPSRIVVSGHHPEGESSKGLHRGVGEITEGAYLSR